MKRIFNNWLLPSIFRSETLSKRFLLFYILLVILATQLMGFVGILQTLKNEEIFNPRLRSALIEYNLKQKTSYVVISPYSYYTWLYSICCVALYGGSYVVVIYLAFKTMRFLKDQRKFMSSKTYLLNTQIHNLLLIQVSIEASKNFNFTYLLSF